MTRMQSLHDCPILILAFNRPGLVRHSLKRLMETGARNIWISVDGPRLGNVHDQAAQEQIQSLCHKYGLPASQMRLASNNHGCRKGVMSGISWFLDQAGSGIILEDDIEIQAEYMDVISSLLKRFEDDESVFSISSHFEFGGGSSNHQLEHSRIFRSPLCRVWGWATWKNRWYQHLDICERVLSAHPLECFLALPKPYRTADAAIRLAVCQAGTFDTWDYEWNFSHLYRNACSLTPNGIHCLNHGFRGDATHTTGQQAPWADFSGSPVHVDLLEAQSPVSEVPGDAWQMLRQCGYPPIRCWPWQGLRLMKHEIRELFR